MRFPRQEYWSGLTFLPPGDLPYPRIQLFCIGSRIELAPNGKSLKVVRLKQLIYKMGKIKDRNGMDLREAEDIRKRWQEYTEELYKKDLHDPDNQDDVITHLEPDI